MQYFDLDDITAHVIKHFPEMEPEGVYKVVKAALWDIGKRATSRIPIKINRREPNYKGFQHYTLYMPAIDVARFHKIKKGQESVRSKRKK